MANAKNPRFLVLMKEARTCWLGGFWCVDVSCFALWLGWAKIGWIGFHPENVFLITLNRQSFRLSAALVQERRNQKMTRKLNQHLASSSQPRPLSSPLSFVLSK